MTVPVRRQVLCIVVPGINGPTLWDCECAECIELQGAYEDDPEEGQ